MDNYPKIYNRHSDLYEIFSSAEDAPGKIARFLIGKFDFSGTVLDMGCGSGKFIPVLSARAKRYYALDASKKLLKIAEQKGDVQTINALAQKILLPDSSVDIVFSSWAISAMNFVDHRDAAVNEGLRVLKKKGVFIVVENSFKGEIQRLFGYDSNPVEYNYQYWLKEKGFSVVKKIKTYFEFDSLKQAKDCMNRIFRKDVGDRVRGRKIEHDVVVFCRARG
ncbi:MAG: class I SAM-dependent methyltransferase [archaeon]